VSTSKDIDNNQSRQRDSHASALDPVGLSADATNPGNQLLRRLGWKDGEGLGQGGGGDVETVASKLEQNNNTSNSSGGVGKGGTPSSASYSGEDTYRRSILKAATARYDQIDEKKQL
jgi:hypothetical protein